MDCGKEERTVQEAMEARERTNVNRDSAKSSTIGTMLVMVTARTK